MLADFGHWTAALRNAVFLSAGNAFQDFFAKFMACVHGADFIPIEAYGPRGDGGLDGFLGPDSTVYQCYGSSSGPASNRDLYIARKIEADFAAACRTVTGMKAWRFVHNLPALPTKAALALSEAAKGGARKGISVSHFGFESFREDMKALDDRDLEYLLGVRALEEIERASLPDIVNGMIFEVMERSGRLPLASLSLGRVAEGKMGHNDIPGDWRLTLLHGSLHADIVTQCINGFGDPRASVEVPNFFRQRYVHLKTQGLDADIILKGLVGMLATPTDSQSRQNAAKSVVATMFEGCIVFEEPPAGQGGSPS